MARALDIELPVILTKWIFVSLTFYFSIYLLIKTFWPGIALLAITSFLSVYMVYN